MNQTYSSDGLGRLARINVSSGVGVAMPAVGTTGLLNQTFGFDSVGNLLNRTLNAPAGAGAARAESETFGYDFLDRFVGHNGSGVTDIGVAGASTNAYDLAGNITSKAGMQMGYTTGSNRLCAITSTTCGSGTGTISYDASGNITRYTRPTAAQAPTVPGADGATLDLLQYTTFNLPLSITKTVAGSITASGQYFYDAGYQRVRQIKRSGPVGTGAFADDILYVVPGGFEVSRDDQGRVKSSVATISGPDGTVATVTTNYDLNTGVALGGGSGINTSSAVSGTNTVTKLLLKDHLGSMVAEVTLTGSVNAQGQVTAGTIAIVASSLNVHGFGPWGNARNGLNGDSRGFTGHEHLAELGLIHMNGRIYDPVLGRFLQADPIIQAPHNAQSHNRYSYVMNNPLSFTDPSGFSAWTKFRDKWLKPIIAIGVAWALGPAGFFAGNGGIFGALTGVATLGPPTAAALSTAQFISSVMAGFAAGGISGGNVQSALQGAFSAGLFFGAGSIGDFAQGSGFSSFAEGGAGRVALHAAAGCASAAAAGGSCGRGAASAGFAEAVGGNLASKIPGGVQGQLISRALIGGLASMIGGGKFANGAMTGAFGYLFNACHGGKCWFQTLSGTLQVVGGGATVIAGASACAGGGLGCVLGIPAGVIGGAEVVQGVDKVVDGVRGIETDGFNPVREAFISVGLRHAELIYDIAALATYGGTMAVGKAPIFVEGGLARDTPIFTEAATSFWDRSRVLFGYVDGAVGQAINRVGIAWGTIKQSYAVGSSAASASNGKD